MVITTRSRLLASLTIGLVSGVVAFAFMSRPGSPGDFFWWYTAAGAVLHGQSPYDVIPAVNPVRFEGFPFYYPLPTALLVTPFAWLPYPVAGGLFVTITSSLLAYGLLSRGWWALVTLLSPAYFVSAVGGSLTIPLTAAALIPAMGVLLVAKPNLAVPLWIYRPRVPPLVAAALLCVVSFLLEPTWLADWIRALRTLDGHPPPILSSAAVLAPLLLLRWRRPAARLVLAMACVPQLAYMYDQLPLWLVPETRREFLVLTFMCQAVYLPWLMFDSRLTETGWHTMELVSLSVLYLTVIVMILRRPAEPVVR